MSKAFFLPISGRRYTKQRADPSKKGAVGTPGSKPCCNQFRGLNMYREKLVCHMEPLFYIVSNGTNIGLRGTYHIRSIVYKGRRVYHSSGNDYYLLWSGTQWGGLWVFQTSANFAISQSIGYIDVFQREGILHDDSGVPADSDGIFDWMANDDIGRHNSGSTGCPTTIEVYKDSLSQCPAEICYSPVAKSILNKTVDGSTTVDLSYNRTTRQLLQSRCMSFASNSSTCARSVPGSTRGSCCNQSCSRVVYAPSNTSFDTQGAVPSSNRIALLKYNARVQTPSGQYLRSNYTQNSNGKKIFPCDADTNAQRQNITKCKQA